MDALLIDWRITAAVMVASSVAAWWLRRRRWAIAPALLVILSALSAGTMPVFIVSPSCGLYVDNGEGSYRRLLAWPGSLPECSDGEN